MKEFIEFVAGVMGVDSSDLTLATEYKSLAEWDSLMMLTLVMELESKYEKEIPIEAVQQVKNLGDLYSAVTK